MGKNKKNQMSFCAIFRKNSHFATMFDIFGDIFSFFVLLSKISFIF